MEFNLNNFEKLFYENKILKTQLKQMEMFVIETREKNLNLIEENSKLRKIFKVKFILLFVRILRKIYQGIKNEIYK